MQHKPVQAESRRKETSEAQGADTGAKRKEHCSMAIPNHFGSSVVQHSMHWVSTRPWKNSSATFAQGSSCLPTSMTFMSSSSPPRPNSREQQEAPAQHMRSTRNMQSFTTSKRSMTLQGSRHQTACAAGDEGFRSTKSVRSFCASCRLAVGAEGEACAVAGASQQPIWGHAHQQLRHACQRKPSRGEACQPGRSAG